MVRPVIISLLAMLVFFSGFRSIHSEMELTDGGGVKESSGDCGIILPTVQMSQKQLDKLDDTVQSIKLQLTKTIENRYSKLIEKIELFIESKFNELDKKMDSKFHDTKIHIASKLTIIEDNISKFTSHIKAKINDSESSIIHALNVSDTVNNNNACCKLCLETAVYLKNTTTKIKDMNMRTLNVSARWHEMNETIQNQTNLVVPTVENNTSRLDGLLNSTTEPARNVPDIIPTTEVNKPAPSKCDRSQQEECCTVAVVGDNKYTDFIEMSARGRHTVVNMTSAGLQKFTMYFAVRGDLVELLLSPTSPDNSLYYKIGFYDYGPGEIFLWERLPTVPIRLVYSRFTANIISKEKYTYYYVTISDDTLEVGRRGEPPLMNHTNTELRTFKYFSFRRWGIEKGEALYDCTAE